MASGERLHLFMPGHYEPPLVNHAFRRVRLNTSHICLAYTVGLVGDFKSVLARNYAGGGITVRLYWTMASATTGNIQWNSNFERIAENVLDIDSESFGGAQVSGTVAVPATSGVIKVTNINHTNGAQLDSLATGELFRVQIGRVAAASSEASGDAQLLACELLET